MPDIVAICSHTHYGDNSKRPNKRMQSDFGKLRLPQPLMRALACSMVYALSSLDNSFKDHSCK